MATYRVFIRNDEISTKRIGKRSAYSYVDGELRVYSRGTLIWQQGAEPGDAFAILCYNGKTVVKNLIPPYKKGDLVGWLLGFNKHNRSHSEEEFEEILEKYRNRYDWEEYEEWDYVGSNYVFMRCNRVYEDGYHNLVSYIKDTITKNEVLELVPKMVFPTDYTLKLLSMRFGITEEEFNMAQLKGALKPL